MDIVFGLVFVVVKGPSHFRDASWKSRTLSPGSMMYFVVGGCLDVMFFFIRFSATMRSISVSAVLGRWIVQFWLSVSRRAWEAYDETKDRRDGTRPSGSILSFIALTVSWTICVFRNLGLLQMWYWKFHREYNRIIISYALTDRVMWFNTAKTEFYTDILCVLSKNLWSKAGFAIKSYSVRKYCVLGYP